MTTHKTTFKLSAVGTLTLGLLLTTWAGMARSEDGTSLTNHATMHVVKSPTCGCCTAWVSLARDAGFDVDVTDTADVTTTKLARGVPGEMWSCHTATIDGYVIEGHVPFDAIRRLLTARPDIQGIAVPGMPHGTPGMGSDPNAQYDVVSFGGAAPDGQIFYSVGE